MSAQEWLQLADNFLPHEDVVELGRKLSKGIRERREKAKREFERLDRELAGLGQPPDSVEVEVDEEEDEVEEGDDAGPFDGETSVGRLVRYFGFKQPRSLASEFVEFVHFYRPEVPAKVVHSELYRLSRPGGPELFIKEGDRPHTRYRPRRG